MASFLSRDPLVAVRTVALVHKLFSFVSVFESILLNFSFF